MCFVYESYPAFFSSTIVKAKKAHKCSECSTEITVGQAYERVVGSWARDFLSYKICPKCVELRQKIHDIEIKEGCRENESWPPYGELKDVAQYYELM